MIQEITIPNLAFLGVGWIGKNRLDAIIRNGTGKPFIIADTYQPVIDEIKKEYNNSIYCNSLDEILSNEDIQGLVIATPNAMHASQAIAALKKGIPVFCQKPLGRTLKETKEVVEIAKQYNKLLGVDLSYRYTKAFEALVEVIKSGDIGKVYSADLVFHNAYGPLKPWFFDKKLSGGGCSIDLGIHLIDMVLLVLDYPRVKNLTSKLYSKGKLITPNDNEVEDYAIAEINLEDDVSVRLGCSWGLSTICDALIEVSFYGDKGGASFRNVNGSFFDFQSQVYHGRDRKTLVNPPDDWFGKAAVEWSKSLSISSDYNSSAEQFIKDAEVIDKIYGR